MDSVLDNVLFLLGQRMPRLQSSAKPDAKLTQEAAAPAR